MLDNNRVFPSYFHSQCGGYTADGRQVFLKEDLRALWGVRCPYCLESGESIPLWRLTLTKQDLAARLQRAGLVRGPIQSLRPLDEDGNPMTALGRVYAVDAVLASGATVKNIPANDFRLAIGHDRGEMESTFFALAQTATHITFEGQGFGHGVGMCQYGAKYLAQKSTDFRGILGRYYTGVQFVRLW